MNAYDFDRSLVDDLPKNSSPRLFEANRFMLGAPEPGATLIDPILRKGGFMMLHAPRGYGKSWVALRIAWAVATGGTVFGWRVPRPGKVLYADGESGPGELRERLKAIARGAAIEQPPQPVLGDDQLYFTLVRDPLWRDLPPQLDLVDHFNRFAELAANKDLVVIDSLGALTSTNCESVAHQWDWLRQLLGVLRGNGTAVLLLHHSNRHGLQRGVGRREDGLETILTLRRPADWLPQHGLRAELRVEKARHLAGEAVAGIDLAMRLEDGAACWSAEPLPRSLKEKARALYATGLTVRQVAAELGMPRATVGDWREKNVDRAA